MAARYQPEDHLQQGGLARSVGADDRDDAACGAPRMFASDHISRPPRTALTSASSRAVVPHRPLCGDTERLGQCGQLVVLPALERDLPWRPRFDHLDD